MMMRFIGRALLGGILISVSFGCTSIEEGTLNTEKTLAEIFKDRENVPVLEDPDPVTEEPNYEALFEDQSSFRVLDEISTDGELSAYVRELFKVITDQVEEVDPAVKEKFKDITLNDLVRIIDPRKPLDPQLEGFLARLLETEKLHLSQFEIPKIERLEKLEENGQEEDGIPGPDLATDLANFDPSDCAFEVYDQFSLGAQSCSRELEQSLRLVEANYFRRVSEAEERFEKRNAEVLDFGLEKLPLVVNKTRNILSLIKETSSPEDVEGIRANLGYLAAIYAYHLRINMPLWHDYALQLNAWYYDSELIQIAEIREQKDTEAEEAFDLCIDWVNEQIKVEVGRICPGDEPVLY